MAAFIPFPVVVVPEQAVPLVLLREPTWALVSIRAHGYKPLDVVTSGPRLNLFFDDVDHVPQGIWAKSQFPPHREHAQAIVRFAHQLLADPPDGLVIHCAAGISRSTATMIGIGYVLLGTPQAAVELLQQAVKYTRAKRLRLPEHDYVDPNALLVHHLDHALDCKGALSAEVDRARKK